MRRVGSRVLAAWLCCLISALPTTAQRGSELALDLGRASSFEANLSPLDPQGSAPPGARLEVVATGSLDGRSNTSLGTLSAEKSKGKGVLLTATLSGSVHGTQQVQVLKAGQVVADFPGLSVGAVVASLFPSAVGFLAGDAEGFVARFGKGARLEIGGEGFEADELRLLSGPSTGRVEFVSQAELRISGLASLQLESLTQSKCLPEILRQPAADLLAEGRGTGFEVFAQGTGPLRFQWRRDGRDLEDDGRVLGAQSSAVSLAAVFFEDAGRYDVVVSDACGSVLSEAVSLAVKPAAQVPVPAGLRASADVSLGYETGDPQTRELTFPGASFVKVHVAALDLRPGDRLSVSSPDGTEVYTYPNGSDSTSDGGSGFWALSIDGDTAVVTLELLGEDDGQFHSGVVIDRVTQGLPLPEEEVASRAICGSDDKRNVMCYQTSNPTEFARSRAVAKLLLDNGSGSCTAWRVAPSSNYLFTNEHCLTNQADVDAAEVWFNYERKKCSGLFNGTKTSTKVSARNFLQDNFNLDYCLFTVESASSIAGYGSLAVDARVPVLDEEIYIPQHPGGDRKKLALASDMNTGNVCRIDDAVTDGNVANSDTGYQCDTEPGSSGSPVLAGSSDRVVALHHFGGCDNQGVRMDLVWPQVGVWFDWVFQWGNGTSGSIALWNMNTTDKYLAGDFDNDGQDELLAISTAGWAQQMQWSAGNWSWMWGNSGSGSIALWAMNSTDKYYAGDFDDDGQDEVLAISASGWAHLMQWNGTTWQFVWGNGGSGQIALWNMATTDRFYPGDFDSDGRDELLGISTSGWAHLMEWNGSSWQFVWGNSGSGQIALWNLGTNDRYLVGDYDSDGQDEFLALSTTGWAHVMHWNGAAWQWLWGNGGSGTIGLWLMNTGDRYLSGDFDDDGQEEVLAISSGGWVHLMQWNGGGWTWLWGNGGSASLALWSIATTDKFLAGDFNPDGRDELLSISTGGSAHLTAYLP